ncbi:MAG: homoserine O-succinyltransferase, partial [Hyphomicrobiales bacterium]|nr:homoserine O-succinyltransferase [Hyphomicrobiales bacterium]
MPAFVEKRISESLDVAVDRRAHEVSRPIEIGVVNNMPDAALQSTERQILSLLNAASAQKRIRIRFWSLPGMARTEFGDEHILRQYMPFESLWSSSIDALIVTGSEPRESN